MILRKKKQVKSTEELFAMLLEQVMDEKAKESWEKIKNI